MTPPKFLRDFGNIFVTFPGYVYVGASPVMGQVTDYEIGPLDPTGLSPLGAKRTPASSSMT